MITTILSGGLGNQMFQYAAGKVLAERLNTKLKLDVSSFSTYVSSTPREFELSIFNIHEEPLQSFKCKFLLKTNKWRKWLKGLYNYMEVFTDSYAIKYSSKFSEITNKNTVLYGHFQNPKYFQNKENIIHQIFTFRDALHGQNASLADEIKRNNSISIHIRRGDYITNKSASGNFVTCDVEYYDKAIEYTLKEHPDATFYVFSEEFDWIKENINFRNRPFHLIDWNKGINSYLDMQLMSLCKHNIIANSSFSWWGAYLNKNCDKTIIAPNKWFKEDYKNDLLTEFYPKGWLRF